MKKTIMVLILLLIVSCTKNEELLEDCKSVKTTYFYKITNNDVSTIQTYIISREDVECQDPVFKQPTDVENVYYSISTVY